MEWNSSAKCGTWISFSLCRTKVTDAGIPQIANLRDLQTLDCRNES